MVGVGLDICIAYASIFSGPINGPGVGGLLSPVVSIRLGPLRAPSSSRPPRGSANLVPVLAVL